MIMKKLNWNLLFSYNTTHKCGHQYLEMERNTLFHEIKQCRKKYGLVNFVKFS